MTKTSICLWFPGEVDLSCNSGSDGGGDIGPWLSCWCHCGKSNMPREPAPSLSQLLLIGLYYLEQDLNILQIHLQSSTCAGHLKYEFWDLFLEIPDQLLFLTSNTGTDRTSLSPTWTFIVISQVHSWKESRMRRKFSEDKRVSLKEDLKFFLQTNICHLSFVTSPLSILWVQAFGIPFRSTTPRQHLEKVHSNTLKTVKGWRKVIKILAFASMK